MFGKIRNNKKVTYELRDKYNRTSYIGETNNPSRRFKEHKKAGKTFAFLKVTSRALPKRTASKKETADMYAFKRKYSKKPRLNKTWNGKWKKRNTGDSGWF